MRKRAVASPTEGGAALPPNNHDNLPLHPSLSSKTTTTTPSPPSPQSVSAPASSLPTTATVPFNGYHRAPWHERISSRSQHPHLLPPSLRPFMSRYVWWKVTYAVRLSCVAMLIPSILVNVDRTTVIFLSKTFCVLASSICAQDSFGSSVGIFFNYVRSIFVSMTLTTIYIRVGLAYSPYVWSVFYVLSFVFGAYFHDGLAKKVCLAILNVTMVAQLRAVYDGTGPGMHLTFPIRMFGEFGLGLFCGVLSTLIPWPRFAWRRADRKISQAANNIGLAFGGLCDTFWAPSNLQRRVNNALILEVLEDAVENLKDAGPCMLVAHFEPQSLSAYHLRAAKYQLISAFPPLIESALRALEAVCEDPFVIHGSQKVTSFGDVLREPLRQLGEAVEDALDLIVTGTRREELFFDPMTGRPLTKLPLPRHHHYGEAVSDDDDVNGSAAASNLRRQHKQRRKGAGYSSNGGGDSVYDLHPFYRVERCLAQVQHFYYGVRREIYYGNLGCGNDHTHANPLIGKGGAATAAETTATADIGPTKNVDFLLFDSEPREAPVHHLYRHGMVQQPHHHQHGDMMMTTSTTSSTSHYEFGALLAFYIFTLSTFATKTQSYTELATRRLSTQGTWSGFALAIFDELWLPLKSSLLSTLHLIGWMCPTVVLTQWAPMVALFKYFNITPEQIVVAGMRIREAIKFSAAMGLSLLFDYYTDRRWAFLQGAQVLCFIASTTSSEAFYNAVLRLIGTLFGGILGFFTTQYVHTKVESIVAITVIAAFCGFFRSGKQFGGSAIYTVVVYVSLLGGTRTEAETIARITQIIFANLIYFFISILIFPTQPASELVRARLQTQRRLSNAFAVVMKALVSPLPFSTSSTSSALPLSSLQPIPLDNDTTHHVSSSHAPFGEASEGGGAAIGAGNGDGLRAAGGGAVTDASGSPSVFASVSTSSSSNSAADVATSPSSPVRIPISPDTNTTGSPGFGGDGDGAATARNHSMVIASFAIRLPEGLLEEGSGGGVPDPPRAGFPLTSLQYPSAARPTSIFCVMPEKRGGVVFNNLSSSSAVGDGGEGGATTAAATSDLGASTMRSGGAALDADNDDGQGGPPDGGSIRRRISSVMFGTTPDGGGAPAKSRTATLVAAHGHAGGNTSGISSSGSIDDAVLHAAQAAVAVLDTLIAKGAAWMPLAEIQPRLSKVPYPSAACKAYHSSITKMRSLVDLMVEALKALRRRRKMVVLASSSPPPPPLPATAAAAGSGAGSGDDALCLPHAALPASTLLFEALLQSLFPMAVECIEAFGILSDMVIAKIALGEAYSCHPLLALQKAKGELCCGGSGGCCGCCGSSSPHRGRRATSGDAAALSALGDAEMGDGGIHLEHCCKKHRQSSFAAHHHDTAAARGASDPPSSPAPILPPIVSTVDIISATLAFEGLCTALNTHKARCVGQLVRVAWMVHRNEVVARRGRGRGKEEGAVPPPPSYSPSRWVPASTTARSMAEWTTEELQAAADAISREGLTLADCCGCGDDGSVKVVVGPVKVGSSSTACSGGNSTPSSRDGDGDGGTHPPTHHPPRHDAHTISDDDADEDEGGDKESNKNNLLIVANEDSEGLHTFTLCLVMFGKEMKRLVMAVNTLQQHAMLRE